MQVCVARTGLFAAVLAADALARCWLVALLRPLASHVKGLPPEPADALYYNALLQAIARFRSRLAADVALDILDEAHRRRLPVSTRSTRALLRDDFCTPPILARLRPPPELSLRAHASHRNVQQAARSLLAVREHCLAHGIPPPCSAHDGAAHKANTQYLRALRDDRRAAFRYFHLLLQRDIANPDPGTKSIDIYDWTTALHAAAHDRSLPARALLDLFNATKDRTHAYRPTRATYTVVIQGLLWRNALDDAQILWDHFLTEVVAASSDQMRIDRKALCVGVDLLVQSGRTDEALYLLDQTVQREPDCSVHPIHALFSALLRIRRPDAIYYVWMHLSPLYRVPRTNLMLRILLKAAIQASQMDAESLKGAMRWYMADKPLFQKATPQDTAPRDTLASDLGALLQTTPNLVGIWANRRATDVARTIFRGMILGNWPALRDAAGPGVTTARARGADSVLQEFSRVLARRPHFLPDTPPLADAADPAPAPDAGPIPTIVPSESTFATYVALLGLASRAGEIPEVLVWMRALGVVPRTETLAVALVFWMEVGLRGPVFGDGWRAGRVDAGAPRTEWGALRAWVHAWAGERAPTEADMCAGIKRVREMRGGRFGRAGGVLVTEPGTAG